MIVPLSNSVILAPVLLLLSLVLGRLLLLLLTGLALLVLLLGVLLAAQWVALPWAGFTMILYGWSLRQASIQASAASSP